jgi:hypothetical protein
MMYLCNTSSVDMQEQQDVSLCTTNSVGFPDVSLSTPSSMNLQMYLFESLEHQ